MALHKWIQKLMDTDGITGLITYLKSVPFEHPCHRHIAREFYQIGKVKTCQPFAVVADFELFL